MPSLEAVWGLGELKIVYWGLVLKLHPNSSEGLMYISLQNASQPNVDVLYISLRRLFATDWTGRPGS